MRIEHPMLVGCLAYICCTAHQGDGFIRPGYQLDASAGGVAWISKSFRRNARPLHHLGQRNQFRSGLARHRGLTLRYIGVKSAIGSYGSF